MGTEARTAARRLPCGPGVYRFLDARGTVLYAGRAVDLRRRVLSYWSDLRDRPHLAGLVRRIAAVAAVPCDSEHEAAWLERNLLERDLPRWNPTAGGQEVVTWLRLDDGAAAPGLATVHEPPAAARGPAGRGRWWGPYLGGTRVRLAVTGLLRAYPLHLAAAAPAGTAAALAAARGVTPADRPALAAALRAVLAREPSAPDAVAALTAVRDEAAGALAYERAATVQAELAAVGWLLAPQRVTAREPYDLTVHGRAAGVLVTFEIRAGRLDGWTQRRTDAESGTLAGACPPEWRAFTDRAAALAADLSRAAPSAPGGRRRDR